MRFLLVLLQGFVVAVWIWAVLAAVQARSHVCHTSFGMSNCHIRKPTAFPITVGGWKMAKSMRIEDPSQNAIIFLSS